MAVNQETLLLSGGAGGVHPSPAMKETLSSMTMLITLYLMLLLSFLWIMALQPARAQTRVSPVCQPESPICLKSEIIEIDGRPVLFQGGLPMPSFDTYTLHHPQRAYIDLGGEWRFRIDPEQIGERDRWYTKDFDDSAWLRVTVPGPWDEIEQGQFKEYDGRVWYRRTFDFSPQEGRHARLVALGIADDSIVYINGEAVAGHRGGYLPFSFDITPYLVPGENSIAVMAYRRPWGTTDYSALPPRVYDWWPYGGIVRPIYIEIAPEVSIVKTLVHPATDGVEVDVVVINQGAAVREIALQLDSGVDPEADAGTHGQSISIRPREVRVVRLTQSHDEIIPWSPLTPQLYTARVTMSTASPGDDVDAIDSLSTRWGLVRRQVDGTALTVNGQREFLKGVNWHADYPGVGPSMTFDMIDADLEMLKAAGGNTVRLSHYPRHPYVYDLADQLGLYLIDEVPLYWMNGVSFATQIREGWAKDAVARMVWNGFNHPSVLMWSLMNESDTHRGNRTLARQFAGQLIDTVRQVDHGRPVIFSSNRLQDDAIMDLFDVIGVNEYFGFFYGAHSDVGPYLDWLHQQYPDKPILVTEFGDWAVRGTQREGGQAITLYLHWNAYTQRSEFMLGGVWWVYIDHLSRHQPTSAIPYISTMGLLSRDRQQKSAYRMFQSLNVPYGSASGGD